MSKITIGSKINIGGEGEILQAEVSGVDVDYAGRPIGIYAHIWEPPKPAGHDFEWAVGKMLKGLTVVEGVSGIKLRYDEGQNEFIDVEAKYAFALSASEILSLNWSLADGEENEK